MACPNNLQENWKLHWHFSKDIFPYFILAGTPIVYLLSPFPFSVQNTKDDWSGKYQKNPNMNPNREKCYIASWSMYQSLHEEVINFLVENDLHIKFRNADNDIEYLKKRDTNIMGRFTCQNKACRVKGWSSNGITITIFGFTTETCIMWEYILWHHDRLKCWKDQTIAVMVD